MTVGKLRGLLAGTGALAGLAMMAPVAAHAQAQTSGTRFGVEADYADHFDLGLGAFVKFHLADMNAHPITGRVSFDYYFPGSYSYDCGDFLADSCSYSQHYFQISADGLYDIANHSSNVKPYVGAGVEFAHYSVSFSDCPNCNYGGSSGGVGLNVLGGLNFMANSKLMPFVEVKLGLAGSVGAYGGSVLTIKGGIHLK